MWQSVNLLWKTAVLKCWLCFRLFFVPDTKIIRLKFRSSFNTYNRWKEFFRFLRLYFSFLCCILHNTLFFYKKLIYNKLRSWGGLKHKRVRRLSWLSSQSFRILKTRKQCKEYFEAIPLHCWSNALICFAIRPMIPNRKTHRIYNFWVANKIFHNNLCFHTFMHYHISSLISASLPIIT